MPIRTLTSIYWVLRDILRPFFKSSLFRAIAVTLAIVYFFTQRVGAFSFAEINAKTYPRASYGNINPSNFSFGSPAPQQPFTFKLTYDGSISTYSHYNGMYQIGGGNNARLQGLGFLDKGTLFNEVYLPYNDGGVYSEMKVTIPKTDTWYGDWRGIGKDFTDAYLAHRGLGAYLIEDGKVKGTSWAGGKKRPGYLFYQENTYLYLINTNSNIITRVQTDASSPSDLINGTDFGGSFINDYYTTEGDVFSFERTDTQGTPNVDTVEVIPRHLYGHLTTSQEYLRLDLNSLTLLGNGTAEYYETVVAPINQAVQNSCQKYSSIVEKQIMRLNLCRQWTASDNPYGRTGDNEYQTMFLNNYNNRKNYPPLIMEQNPNNPRCNEWEDNQRILYEQMVGRFEGTPSYSTGLLETYQDTITQQVYVINNPGSTFNAQSYCNMNEYYLNNGLTYEQNKQLGFLDYMGSIIGLVGSGDGQTFYDDIRNIQGLTTGSGAMLGPIKNIIDTYFQMENKQIIQVDNYCSANNGSERANMFIYGIMFTIMMSLFFLLNR